MSKSLNLKSQKKKNPISRFMFWLVVIVFVVSGVLVSTGYDKLFSKLLLPMAFFCTLTFTIWAIFEYRRGIISVMWSYNGNVSNYRRAKEPVWFFFLVVWFFSMGLVFTGIFGSAWLFG